MATGNSKVKIALCRVTYQVLETKLDIISPLLLLSQLLNNRHELILILILSYNLDGFK